MLEHLREQNLSVTESKLALLLPSRQASDSREMRGVERRRKTLIWGAN